jgi:hypothetical protein
LPSNAYDGNDIFEEASENLDGMPSNLNDRTDVFKEGMLFF